MSRQKRWRVSKMLFMGVLWWIIIRSQMNGVGFVSLSDVEPTMSQAIHEIWSMIALVGFMLVALLPDPSKGES